MFREMCGISGGHMQLEISQFKCYFGPSLKYNILNVLLHPQNEGGQTYLLGL